MPREWLIQLAGVWLTVSLKCIPVYILAQVLSSVPARRRPAWRSYIWLLVVFSFPCLSVLEWRAAKASSVTAVGLAGVPEVWLFAITHAYAIVCLVLLGLIVHSAVRLSVLRRYSSPLDIRVEEEDADVPRAPFLLHGTMLYRNGQLSAPTSFGILRAAIVLPEPPIGTIYRHFVRAALVHELIKVLRFDALWTLLARLVQCVYFAHPVVWIAFRQYCLAREQVCDRWTVRTTGDVSEYETHLLAITRPPARVAPMSIDTPMEFTGAAGVRARIADLQNFERPESLQPWPSVAASVGWMLLIATIAALDVTRTETGWRPTIHIWPMLMGATGALIAGAGLSLLILIHRIRRSRTSLPIDGLGARSRLTITDCVERLEREWQELQAVIGTTARRFEPVFLMLIVVAATVSFWLIAGQDGRDDSRARSLPEALADESRWP